MILFLCALIVTQSSPSPVPPPTKVQGVPPAIKKLIQKNASRPSNYGLSEMTMLKSRYAALNKAIQTINFPAFKQWLADNATSDFFMRSGSGSIDTLSETLSSMKNQFLVLKAVKASTFSIGNLSLHPKQISCSIKSHLDALTKDNRHLVQDSVAVDTWRLVNGKWKLYSLVTTRSKVTVNGKPLQMIG